MASKRALVPVLRGRAEQVSTRLGFLIMGFSMAALAPLVPFIKARSALSDSGLGLLLLCFGIGSILTMPLAGFLAGRFGCRCVIMTGAILICLMLPVLAAATYLPLLIFTLFLFGAGLGAIDCAVNIQAVIVERASGRSMMSGFHGLFSAGGIISAVWISFVLGLGATPLIAALFVVVGIIAVLIVATPHLIPFGSEGQGSTFAIPRGVVLFIGTLCFIVFLTEGAAIDWSGVFLTSARGVAPSYAGLGYAAFACTMTIGRLMGDTIVNRVGLRRVVTLGSLCAAAGLALVTLVPAWEAALLGYALVGTGCSNIVPMLYTAVGRQSVMPEHAAVPAITTLGYAGILVGPAGIGFVAHATSLSVALLIVAALLVGVAVSGRQLPG